MRLWETTGDSLDSARLMETHETQRDYRGLMRLKRLLGTHETLKDYCGLKRLMRIVETHGDS